MAICGAIYKYDINNFTLYILEVIDLDATKEYLSDRENYWYQLINPSYNLQNIIQPFTGWWMDASVYLPPSGSTTNKIIIDLVRNYRMK